MGAYCDRQSVELNSIAFLFDGRRLRGDQTPDEVWCLSPLNLVSIYWSIDLELFDQLSDAVNTRLISVAHLSYFLYSYQFSFVVGSYSVIFILMFLGTSNESAGNGRRRWNRCYAAPDRRLWSVILIHLLCWWYWCLKKHDN